MATHTHTPQPLPSLPQQPEQNYWSLYPAVFSCHWVEPCVFQQRSFGVCAWESLPFLASCLSGQVSGEWQACGSTTWEDLHLFSFAASCSLPLTCDMIFITASDRRSELNSRKICKFLAPAVADLTLLKSITSLSAVMFFLCTMFKSCKCVINWATHRFVCFDMFVFFLPYKKTVYGRVRLCLIIPIKSVSTLHVTFTFLNETSCWKFTSGESLRENNLGRSQISKTGLTTDYWQSWSWPHFGFGHESNRNFCDVIQNGMHWLGQLVDLNVIKLRYTLT